VNTPILRHRLFAHRIERGLGEQRLYPLAEAPQEALVEVDEFEALLDRLSPQEFAVSLTAKGGMRPADYVEVLERRWAALGTGEPASYDGRPERDARHGVTGGVERARKVQLVSGEAPVSSDPKPLIRCVPVLAALVPTPAKL